MTMKTNDIIKTAEATLKTWVDAKATADRHADDAKTSRESVGTLTNKLAHLAILAKLDGDATYQKIIDMVSVDGPFKKQEGNISRAVGKKPEAMSVYNMLKQDGAISIKLGEDENETEISLDFWKGRKLDDCMIVTVSTLANKLKARREEMNANQAAQQEKVTAALEAAIRADSKLEGKTAKDLQAMAVTDPTGYVKVFQKGEKQLAEEARLAEEQKVAMHRAQVVGEFLQMLANGDLSEGELADLNKALDQTAGKVATAA